MQIQSSSAALSGPAGLRASTGPYRSQRAMAWRNAMVAAINAGLEKRLFGLGPGENWWPNADAAVPLRTLPPTGASYRFVFPGDVPALAWVGDSGFDELAVHIALWPTPEAERWVFCTNGDWSAGEVFASGWVERRRSAYLQQTPELLRARRDLIGSVAGTVITPLRDGYRDRGRFIF